MSIIIYNINTIITYLCHTHAYTVTHKQADTHKQAYTHKLAHTNTNMNKL